MSESPLLGRPLWYELLTTDIESAKPFYAAVVGWDVTPFDGAPTPYYIFSRAGDGQVGGVMPLPDGMNVPPHWVMYPQGAAFSLHQKPAK